MKNIKKYTKQIHITVIILGGIMFLLASFHRNIWFDEAYTVGLINQKFVDMCKIGINDVHPLLYYILVKIFTLFFGKDIIVLRIFSSIGMIILSILGFTHIRKDFGEKVGLIFSFLVSFLPVMLLYAVEIRMYSWAAVFVLLTAIYAYRMLKNNQKKDYFMFVIFSLISAYTHYFALVTVGIINFIVLIYVLFKKKQLLKKYIILAVTQIILYIPGIIIFVKQATRVASGFWITIKYPDIFLDILKFHFLGNITSKIVTIFVILFYIYIIVKTVMLYKENKKEMAIPLLAVTVYVSVIVSMLLVSLISEIFTVRYLMPMTGLLILFLSYILAKEDKKWITITILIIISGLSILNSYNFYEEIYNKDNTKLQQLINSEISKDDIFIYTSINNGSIIATYFPENKQYFYNINHWTVEEAYKAFSPQLECIDDLTKIDEYKGKIWIIDDNSENVYDTISKYSNINVLKKLEKINIPYKNAEMYVSLIEKY